VIVQGFTTSGKLGLLKGEHKFRTSGGHTFKLALYTSDATLSPETTDYTTTGEVSGTGYTAGGQVVTVSAVTTSNGIAYVDFGDVTWSNASFTARGALLYNTTTDGGSSTTDAIMVLNFGIDRTKSGEDFVVTMPTADSTTAIIRL